MNIKQIRRRTIKIFIHIKLLTIEYSLSREIRNLFKKVDECCGAGPVQKKMIKYFIKNRNLFFRHHCVIIADINQMIEQLDNILDINTNNIILSEESLTKKLVPAKQVKKIIKRLKQKKHLSNNNILQEKFFNHLKRNATFPVKTSDKIQTVIYAIIKPQTQRKANKTHDNPHKTKKYRISALVDLMSKVVTIAKYETGRTFLKYSIQKKTYKWSKQTHYELIILYHPMSQNNPYKFFSHEIPYLLSKKLFTITNDTDLQIEPKKTLLKKEHIYQKCHKKKHKTLFALYYILGILIANIASHTTYAEFGHQMTGNIISLVIAFIAFVTYLSVIITTIKRDEIEEIKRNYLMKEKTK